jgi:hypothetical protein
MSQASCHYPESLLDADALPELMRLRAALRDVDKLLVDGQVAAAHAADSGAPATAFGVLNVRATEARLKIKEALRG